MATQFKVAYGDVMYDGLMEAVEQPITAIRAHNAQQQYARGPVAWIHAHYIAGEVCTLNKRQKYTDLVPCSYAIQPSTGHAVTVPGDTQCSK